MPSGSYKGKADALCPFYKSDDEQKKRIICEGIVDKSTLALTFRRRNDYDTQLGVFCCEHYKKCEIYRMLMENKYDEED
jgi:hypothetical protein